MKLSKRHKKLPLKTRVFGKIEEIDPADWKKVFPDILESYDFFSLIDECGLEGFSQSYLLVYDRRTLVGAAPLFTLNYSLDTSVDGPLRQLTNSIKKIWPHIFSMKAIVVGMPIGRGRIGSSTEVPEVIKAISRRVEGMARRQRCSIVAFKDFEPSARGALDRLLNEGFFRFDSLPSAEMEINFKSFEEYLNKKLSAASRYDFRRKIKASSRHGSVEMRIRDSLNANELEKAYELYLQIVDKHDMGFELMPIEFFRDAPKKLHGRAKFFLWYVDGHMAAFLFSLVSKDLFIDYYLGLDYAVAHKNHLYFIKFRDVLNWCIEHKIKKYEMGISGYEPKRRLGFDFVHLYLYVKHRNAFVRPMFNFFCRFLKFENFDPVLKEIMRNKPL